MRTAVLLFIAAALLGALVAPRKSVVAAYALLTGLYPIVKYGVEARLPRQVQTGVKLAYFNLVLAAAAVLVVCGLFPNVAPARLCPSGDVVAGGQFRLYDLRCGAVTADRNAAEKPAARLKRE